MRLRVLVLGAVVLASGCASSGIGSERYPDGSRRGDVLIVSDDDDRDDRNDDRRRYPRALSGIPKGHHPPPGECRIWYPGRPAGHQPPPTRCGALFGRVPRGAFVLYNQKAWDMEYDWRREERRDGGSVPDVILDLVRSAQRD